MSNLLRPAASRLAATLAAPADGALSPAASGPPQAGFDPASLKILHILRAPLGGLFRHVLKVFLLDEGAVVREIYTTAYLFPEVIVNDIKTLRLADQPKRRTAR